MEKYFKNSYNNNGELCVSPYVDERGKPIKRTPITHPYNYEGFVLWGNNSPLIKGCIYTDHLYTWDSKKHDELCMKHFGDRGQYWDKRDPQKIQDFLKDWTGKNIRLVMIMQHCNQSSGYPLWSFHYFEE